MCLNWFFGWKINWYPFINSSLVRNKQYKNCVLTGRNVSGISLFFQTIFGQVNKSITKPFKRNVRVLMVQKRPQLFTLAEIQLQRFTKGVHASLVQFVVLVAVETLENLVQFFFIGFFHGCVYKSSPAPAVKRRKQQDLVSVSTTPASSVHVENEKTDTEILYYIVHLYVGRQRDETTRLSVDKIPTAIGENQKIQNPYTVLARALRPVTARRITDNILNRGRRDVRRSCFSEDGSRRHTICHRSDARKHTTT